MAVSFVRGHLRKSKYGLQKVRRHSRSIRGVRITKRSRVSRAFVPSGLGPNKRGKIPGHSNRGGPRDETVRVTGQAVGARRKKIKAAKRGERNIIPVTGTGARRREAARKGGRLSAANHPTNPPRATSPALKRKPKFVADGRGGLVTSNAHGSMQRRTVSSNKDLKKSASRVRSQQNSGVRVKESLRSQNLRVDKDRITKGWSRESAAAVVKENREKRGELKRTAAKVRSQQASGSKVSTKKARERRNAAGVQIIKATDPDNQGIQPGYHLIVEGEYYNTFVTRGDAIEAGNRAAEEKLAATQKRVGKQQASGISPMEVGLELTSMEVGQERLVAGAKVKKVYPPSDRAGHKGPTLIVVKAGKRKRFKNQFRAADFILGKEGR